MTCTCEINNLDKVFNNNFLQIVVNNCSVISNIHKNIVTPLVIPRQCVNCFLREIPLSIRTHNMIGIS